MTLVPENQTLNRLFPSSIAVAPYLFGSAMTALLAIATIWLLPEVFKGRSQNDQSNESRVFGLRSPAVIGLVTVLVSYYLLIVLPTIWDGTLFVTGFFAGTYLHFLLAPLLLIGLYRRNPRETYLQSFIRGLRIGLPVALVMALVQFTLFPDRPEGMMGNPLVFATISLAGGFAAMAKLPNDTRNDRALAWLSYASATAIVLLANARGMMIAWPVLTIALVWHLSEPGKRLATIAMAIGLPLILASLTILSSPHARSVAQFRVIEPIVAIWRGEAPEASVSSRLELYAAGLHAFANKPLTGHGIANIRKTTEAAAAEIFPGRPFNARRHLHNDYLNHAVAGGVVLLCLFVAVLALPVLFALRGATGPMSEPRLYVGIITSGTFAMAALTNLVFGHDLLQSYFLGALLMIVLSSQQSSPQDTS